VLGVIGELHPLVAREYDLEAAPVLAADLELSVLSEAFQDRYPVAPVPSYPAVLEDLAVVVDERVPAEEVQRLILETGGHLVEAVNLFDLYRGEQIGAGKKSLAYSLVYQAGDRTLTDEEVAEIRRKIITRLNEALGAELRA
jgi:phenylalanyl-tRNA synthetase beta chain